MNSSRHSWPIPRQSLPTSRASTKNSRAPNASSERTHPSRNNGTRSRRWRPSSPSPHPTQRWRRWRKMNSTCSTNRFPSWNKHSRTYFSPRTTRTTPGSSWRSARVPAATKPRSSRLISYACTRCLRGKTDGDSSSSRRTHPKPAGTKRRPRRWRAMTFTAA